MNRRRFLQLQALAAGALGSAPALAADAPVPRRGVSLAGPEFGAEAPAFSNESPGVFGRHYTFNSERTVAYFCEAGLGLLRLPLRWERLQPRPGGPLHEEELGRITTFVGWARKHGGRVILDLHNYGRYVLQHKGQRVACVIDAAHDGDSPVTRAHFADLWARLARHFRGDEAVWAYGLMNEPHDLGGSDWKAISQAAVDAVRAEGDRKLVLVAGDRWSGAHTFARSNGLKAWVKDPAGRVAYEAHCYFDRDHSGRYRQSHADEHAADAALEWRGAERLLSFVGWCRANGVAGFVGEFGTPRGDPGWNKVLANMLEVMDGAGMAGCWWAAGEWWRGYGLSLQPSPDFRRPAPQMSLLKP
jgi:endoglucanase